MSTSTFELCRSFQRGHCPRGASCKYSHGTTAESIKRLFGTATEEPAAKRYKPDLDGTTITVVVGGEASLFQVHKALICEHSGFFNSTLHGDWKESQDKTVKLPDDDPNIFKIYMLWIYLGAIRHEIDDDNIAPDTRKSLENRRLLESWIFGEKCQDYGFANAVLDNMVECYGRSAWVYDHDHSTIVYANTVEGSPLRKFLVDVWGYGASREILDGLWSVEPLPVDFLRDVMRTMADNRRTDTTPLFCKDLSSYHFNRQ